jgi:multidrug efflux system membrane fusion protein
MLAGVAVLAVMAAAGVYLFDSGRGQGSAAAVAANAGPPAMPVPVVKIVKKTIPVYFEYSARTEAIRDVALQAKVTGYVHSQPVADGADVKEGDLLYKIDERDYVAAVDQANAQALRDSAALDYARANYNRGNELVHTGFLAKDSFEQRASAFRQGEAALAMDRALARTAQLNLDYTEIRAPFAGRVGRNRASVGTLVGGAGTTLNTLVQLDPIYVTFNPSESDLAKLQEARSATPVMAEVLVPGDPQAHHSGKVTFIDNSVDRATGTITVRATIANPDFTLLPGQYVRVRVCVREQPDALMVPETALGSGQLGKYVYVVGADKKAEQRLVTLGPADGDLVSVQGGVAEGDQIITGNLQKIGPGAPVQPLLPKQASAKTM